MTSLSDEAIRGYLSGAEMIREGDSGDVLADVISDLSNAALDARSAFNLVEWDRDYKCRYDKLVQCHDDLRVAVMRIAAHLELGAMLDMREAAFGGPTALLRKANAGFLRGEAGLLRDAVEEVGR